MDEEPSDAEVDAFLDTCSRSDFVEAMRLLLSSWAGKLRGKTQPPSASMDKETFDEVVKFARIFLERSPMGKRTPGGARLSAYELEDSAIKSALILMSETERWAWDATVAMAIEWMREERYIPRRENPAGSRALLLGGLDGGCVGGEKKAAAQGRNSCSEPRHMRS